MSSRINSLLASTVATLCLVGAAAAQDQRFDVVVTDSDRPFGTAGYTFVVIPITVLDAPNFRVDAVNTVGTINPVSIVDFIIFLDGVAIPEGPGTNYSSLGNDANAVGYFWDSTPQGQNPTQLTTSPAGPLTNGDFQLVVAPYDSAGTGGDYTVTLELYGVTSPIAPLLGPTTDEELANLIASSNGATLVFVNGAGSVVRMHGHNSLATRDQQRVTFTQVASGQGDDLVTVSTQGRTGLVGNLYTWAEVTGLRAEDSGNDRDYTGRGLQIGADIEISPNMVAGLSFGVQDLSVSGPAFSQDGVLRFLQPYLAYRSGAWGAEASLVYGLGEFTQTSTGGTGDGETRLTALNLSGGYDMDVAPGLTLTPTVGLSHGVEEITGKTGTLAGSGSTSVRFSEVSLGGRLTRSTDTGSFFAGLHADWLNTSTDTQLVSDLLAEDGWTGRLELGGSFEMDNGMLFDTSVELSGLGGDLRSTSGALRLAIRF